MPALRAPVFRIALLSVAALSIGCGGGDAPPATTDAPAPSASGAPVAAADDAIAALPQGTLEAVALDVGVALDADGRVLTVAERVRASDTVHASLVTVGEADAAMVAVAWRYATGAEIHADERAITAAGPAVHTFSRKPEGGWTPGRYEVEVRINGASAGVRPFEVR